MSLKISKPRVEQAPAPKNEGLFSQGSGYHAPSCRPLRHSYALGELEVPTLGKINVRHASARKTAVISNPIGAHPWREGRLNFNALVLTVLALVICMWAVMRVERKDRSKRVLVGILGLALLIAGIAQL